MVKNIVIAGFGGQGVLFSGKVLAYAGLCEGYEVSWLPSYGPEMRGGTANCSVVISDRPIGSPLVINPDILVAMNLPSYDKFIDSVAENGIVIMDSSLIDRDCNRKDITVYKVPATTLSEMEDLEGLSNMIILGKLLEATKLLSESAVEEAVKKSVSARKQDLIAHNLRAIETGKAQ